MISKKSSSSQQNAGATSSGPFNVLIALESFRHLLSVAEVAPLLRKSTCSVYRMAEHELIPAFRIGGAWRFDPSAIAAWLTKKDPSLAVAARQQANAARRKNPAPVTTPTRQVDTA